MKIIGKYPFESITKIRTVPERRLEPCKQDMGSLIYRSRHLHSALNHTHCGFDLVDILVIMLFFPEALSHISSITSITHS